MVASVCLSCNGWWHAAALAGELLDQGGEEWMDWMLHYSREPTRQREQQLCMHVGRAGYRQCNGFPIGQMWWCLVVDGISEAMGWDQAVLAFSATMYICTLVVCTLPKGVPRLRTGDPPLSLAWGLLACQRPYVVDWGMGYAAKLRLFRWQDR